MNLNRPSITLPTTHFTQTATNVFHKNPFEWQVKVGARIVSAVRNGESIRSLCVRPTGGGKTLLFTTTAATLKGITLCIIPLLSLGSDQVKKLINSTQSSANIITGIHLDELPISLHGNLLTHLPNYDAKTKTLIIFASPQSLLNPLSPILECLIAESSRLSMVVVDEVHLACHFGNTFRKEFRSLKTGLFDKLHSKVPLLFLTATCTLQIKMSFESLFGIRITYNHWPSAKEMANRKVKLNVHYTTRPFKVLIRNLKDKVTSPSPLPNKVIVYSNQRTKIITCADSIEGFLDNDDDLWDRDVLTLIGTLTREEKAHLIKVFLDDKEPKLNVLCATSGVGNAGIDSPNIRAVYRTDFPPSILDISQECGRAGRRPDATPDLYSYDVCFSLEGFLHLFKRIHDKDNEVLNEEYRSQQEQDLFTVAKLLASRTKCYYSCFEMYLGNPAIPCHIVTPGHVEENTLSQGIEPCGNCPNCRNEPIFPFLNKAGVKEVLFNLFVQGPVAISEKRTWKTVLDALRNYKDINMKVFNSRAKNANRSKIAKVMFVLIVFGILNISLDNDGDITMEVARSMHSNTELAFNNDQYWIPISHY